MTSVCRFKSQPYLAPSPSFGGQIAGADTTDTGIDLFIKRNVNANSKRFWPNCGMHDEAVCSGDVSCQNLLLHVLSNVN